MPLNPTKTMGLNDLIMQVKEELLSEQSQKDPKLFSIDEVIVEVNFVISGDIDSGFNLGVVTLGSQVNEERVHKVTVKMTPIVSKQQLLEGLNNDGHTSQQIVEASKKAVFRGGERTTRGG